VRRRESAQSVSNRSRSPSPAHSHSSQTPITRTSFHLIRHVSGHDYGSVTTNDIYEEEGDEEEQVDERSRLTPGVRATNNESETGQLLDRVTITVQRDHPGQSSSVKEKLHWFKAFLKFVGPGFMIGVGYLDPGNWATDLAGSCLFVSILL
jgi:hypothetical protein